MCNEPILKSLFEPLGLEVYLYGVFIALGILLCLAVFYIFTKKKKMPQDVQDFTFFVVVIAILVGFLIAKVYQAVYNWLDTGKWDFYNAGITVMGGLIGGAGMFILTYFLGGKLVFKNKKLGLHKTEFNKIVLVAPICICVAHGFGRLGCLMAGCCHGAFLSEEPIFGGIFMHTPKSGSGYFVPTQLYEALFLFALAIVLSILYFKQSNLIMPIYLIAYGIWRIFIEFFRTDERGFIFLGLAPSQWMSFIFIAGGVAMILFYYYKKIPFILPKDNNGENFGKTKNK